MKLASVARYASGKAPFLGVPYFSLTAGKYQTAVFRKEHLQAAVSCPHVTKASYDEDAHVLTLNGSPRAEYKLRDLKFPSDQVASVSNTSGQRIYFSNREPNYNFIAVLRDIQTAWAEARRKSANTRALSPEARKTLKLQEEIRKLEKQRDKIYAARPVHPLLLRPGAVRHAAGEWERKHEQRWIAEKPLRWALGVLVRKPRGTWARFYAEVGALAGRTVGDAQRHDRVCHRRGGPSLSDYLKYLYKHVGLSEKGYARGRPHTWGDAFARHREARVEYLHARREREALESLIEGAREQIRELETEAKNDPN